MRCGAQADARLTATSTIELVFHDPIDGLSTGLGLPTVYYGSGPLE